MSNTEIFILDGSFVNGIQVYLNWYVSLESPTDTVETDTFYLSYFNRSTLQTSTINTGNVMNYWIDLTPNTTYDFYIYSINQLIQQSANSNVITLTTGDVTNNQFGANWEQRPYNMDAVKKYTIEDLSGVVSISASSAGIESAEPTSIAIVNSSSPKPFYQLYRIDPKGDLFGTNPCGFYNFRKRTTVV